MSEHGPEIHTNNKGVALLIAILALFLAFSEMGGNNAEREAQAQNLEASNLWAFFQAKTIRRTSVQVAAEQVEAQLVDHQRIRRSAKRCRSASPTGRRQPIVTRASLRQAKAGVN